MWHYWFITGAAWVHIWDQRQLILTCPFRQMQEWHHISCHKHMFPIHYLPYTTAYTTLMTHHSINLKQITPHKWHYNLQQQHINSPNFQRRSSSVTISTLLNRLSWNWYTFSDSGKQPAIPVMTMSSSVGRQGSVEIGMSCCYSRFYCK